MDTTLKTLVLTLVLAAAASAQEDSQLPKPSLRFQLGLSPRPAAEPVPDPGAELHFYDVGDITGSLAAEELQTGIRDGALGHDAEWMAQQLEQVETRSGLAVEAATDLATMIKTYVQPALDDVPGQIRALGGSSLVVNCTPEQQHWVETFLARQRSDQRIITVHCQVLGAPLGTLARLGFDPDRMVITLTAEQSAVLRAQLHDEGSLRVLSAPTISTLPRQLGSLSILDEQSFVIDWELRTVQPGDRLFADPRVDTLSEGVEVEVLAVPLSEDSFGLDLHLQHTEIHRPVKTMTVVLDESLDPVEFSLPEVMGVEAAATVVLSPGTQVLFVSSTAERAEDLAVVLELSLGLPGR